MPEQEGFPAEIERAFRVLRDRRGPCPESEALLRFHAGEMAEEEAARLREHARGCGFCQAALAALRRFDEAAATPFPDSSGAVSSLEPRRPFWRLLFSPALAYALVLALLYPAYLGLFSQPEDPVERIVLRPPPPELASARVFDLRQVRAAGESEVVLQPDEQMFILSFWVPVRPGRRYEAKIAGNTVARLRERDQQGNFALVCERRVFEAPGRYVLVVSETEAATGRQEREFRFAFDLRF
jgi:hypothetical protein